MIGAPDTNRTCARGEYHLHGLPRQVGAHDAAILEIVDVVFLPLLNYEL